MKILMVEDDCVSRNYLYTFLQQKGHTVITAENGSAALDYFKAQLFDLVLADIKMPELNGIELLRKISIYKTERDFDVLIITGHGDMETAIESLRIGASDYLLKPIDIKVLASVLDRLEDNQVTRRGNQKIIKQFVSEVDSELAQVVVEVNHPELLTSVPGIGKIGTFSATMQQIVKKALLFHDDRSLPVLILGETGTGKEIIARLIHYGFSNDDEKPFIDINCATLTPSLFESELFGYEAGAFTGAQTKGGKGKMDLAKGGTLFLDEIGEMSIELQAKLLRVIQEKEFYRVGGLKKVQAEVRIICATNVDIQKMVAEGRFRSDLFYRLNIGQFDLPPIRERKEDIIPLAKMFLNEFCIKRGKGPKRIGKKAKDVLINYSWPGNIRQLRNLMELIVFYYDDLEVKVEHLDLIIGNTKSKADLSDDQISLLAYPPSLEIKKVVDDIIYKALEINNGNKTKTAQALGMGRKTLYRHLDKTNKPK